MARKLDIKISFLELVVAVGIGICSAVIAFCLGFYSGQKDGYESSMQKQLSETPKYPIVSNIYDQQLDPSKVSEAYSKLKTNDRDTIFNEKEEQIPELAAIKNAADDSMIESLTLGILEDSNIDSGNKSLDQSSVDSKDRSKNGETLADALGIHEEEREDVVAKVTSTPTLKPTLTPAPKPTVKPTSTPKPTLAPTKKPTPTPTPTPKNEVESSPKLRSGWYAQVVAEKSKERALSLVNRLKSAGYSAAIEYTFVRGEYYYRVVSGPDASREAAENRAKQLMIRNLANEKPFVRLVK